MTVLIITIFLVYVLMIFQQIWMASSVTFLLGKCIHEQQRSLI